MHLLPAARSILGLATLPFLLLACAVAPGGRGGYSRDEGGYPAETKSRPAGYTETGIISYYASSLDGKKTASGAIFHKDGFTAAHRTLPFGTKVKVTNLSNGRSVVVEITDRGPFSEARILDVTPAAARKLGLLGRGTVKAQVEVE